MIRASTPICIAAALGLMLGGASISAAQDQYSEQELQTFAMAVVQVEQISMAAQQQAQAADTPDEQQQVQAQAEAQMVQAIEAQGMTVETYNEIINAVQTDPQLAQQVQAHIMELQ